MRLDQDVFSSPAFGPQIATQYVAVKLNYDQSKKLADQYAIQAIPADVIITPQGQLIQKLNSPAGMKDYVGTMQQIAARAQAQPATAPPTAVVAAGGSSYAPPATPPAGDDRYADYYSRSQPATSARPLRPTPLKLRPTPLKLRPTRRKLRPPIHRSNRLPPPRLRQERPASRLNRRPRRNHQ